MADLRLRAVHAIQRLNAKKKIETVQPGSLFNAKDAEQFKELTSGINPAARPAPVEEVDDESGEKPISKMTKAELLTYAEENDIEVDSDAKVGELRKAIEAAEAGGSDDDDNDNDDGNLV